MEELSQMDEVADIEGTISLDALYRIDEGNESVYKIHALPDTIDMFRSRTYTVVGLERFPYYINFERGTISIGDGRVTAYVYVPKDSFDSEYLTEVFLTLKEKYDVF